MTRIVEKVRVWRQDSPVEGHDVRPPTDGFVEDDHDWRRDLWAIGYDDTAQANKIRYGPDDHAAEPKIAPAEGLLVALRSDTPTRFQGLPVALIPRPVAGVGWPLRCLTPR
jgi:hypothetical protein